MLLLLLMMSKMDSLLEYAKEIYRDKTRDEERFGMQILIKTYFFNASSC